MTSSNAPRGLCVPGEMHLQVDQRRRLFGILILLLWLGAAAAVWLPRTSSAWQKQPLGSMARSTRVRAMGATGWLLIVDASWYDDGRDPFIAMRRISPGGLLLGLAITVTAGAGSFVAWRFARGSRGFRDADAHYEEAPTHCRRCGYDLAGLTINRCPECGKSFRHA